MPAVCVAHGRMKTGGDEEDDGTKTGKSRSSWRAATKSKNVGKLRGSRRTSKSEATALTYPRPEYVIGQPSISDISVVERLMSGKLFGHLITRGSEQKIRECREGSRIGRILQSKYFRIGISMCIFLSAVQMGIASDVDMEGMQVYWDVCEQVFTSIFVVELILKLSVDGLYFFFDAWNIVDFFIAATSSLDAWILPIAGFDANIGFVRTFRLLRLLRIMRMLRIIPEILMVMEGIGASLRSLFWIMFLLVAVLYACSIMCVEVLGKNKDDFPAYSEDHDDLILSSKADRFNNFMFFGSVARSMVSLLGIVFLAEWDVIIRPVFEEYPAMVIVFTIIVVFTTLGILNIIVGVIVENTTQAMEKERRVKESDGKRRKMEFIEQLSKVFDNIDEDRDGALSWFECQRAALKGDKELAQLVYDIDFPPGITFEEIFQILDVDASGAITQDEFINGMFRIVHCDTFQRDCLNLLAIGRVMSKMNRDKEEILSGIRHEVGRAVQEVFRNSAASDSNEYFSSSTHSPWLSPPHSPPHSPSGSHCNSPRQDKRANGISKELIARPIPFLPTSLEPTYTPESKADFVMRLRDAATKVENKLADLCAILREDQSSVDSLASSTLRKSPAFPTQAATKEIGSPIVSKQDMRTRADNPSQIGRHAATLNMRKLSSDSDKETYSAWDPRLEGNVTLHFTAKI